MDYTGRRPRSGDGPMAAPSSALGSSYMYSGYMDQTRGDGTGPANVSSSPMIGTQPVVSGANAAMRPMSLFAASAAAGADQQQEHAMTAPNTATSDRSFHAIMIGDNGHAPMRSVLPTGTLPAASSASTHVSPGVQTCQKQGVGVGNTESMGNVYGSSLPHTLPLRGAHMQRDYPAVNDNLAPGVAAATGHPRIVNPSLNAAASGDSQTLQNNIFNTALPRHSRTASRQYTQMQQSTLAQSQSPAMDSSLLHPGSTGQPAAPGNTLRSAASDNILLSRQQQVSGPAYQTLAMDNAAPGPATLPQIYPVLQPGLPPIGPASATLSDYASGRRSPRLSRGRSRQRPHHGYDYPDTSLAQGFSPGSSPAMTTDAASMSRPQLPPVMHSTRSTNNTTTYTNGTVADNIFLRRRGSSDYEASVSSLQGSVKSKLGTAGFPSSMDMYHANEMPVGTAASFATRAGVYSYPDLTYNSVGAAQDSVIPNTQQMSEREKYTNNSPWVSSEQPESLINGSDYGATEAAAATRGRNATASLSSTGDSNGRHIGSQASLGRSGLTPEGNLQNQEYMSASSSTAHIRWNPASGNSPLRKEIDMSGQEGAPQTHTYGTLPRTGNTARGAVASNGSAHDQSPSAGMEAQRPWPRISPQGIGAQSQQSIHSESPQMRVQTTVGGTADYYMLSSPDEQSYNEPHTPHADSTSLLPMVEVGQSARAPLATNMDEINAHSQEYLHRRRRRLTQTMHNRQRSGSAVDPAARLSASRLNAAISMSSPSANSHASNRSLDEVRVAEQNQYAYQSYAQPLQTSGHLAMPQQQQQQQLSTAAYGSTVPTSYVPVELHPTNYTGTQARVQTEAEAQTQAEYMRRLHMDQERIQQEQLRLAFEQQQQQQTRLRLEQEQEVARYQHFRPLMNLTVDIVETYRKCHPDFQYESARRPRRVLTHPSEGVKNDGFDNVNSDYILYVNDVIGEEEGRQFMIMEMLGSGTFGQVVKCQNLKTGELVAVKVIKNKAAYYNQSMMEVQMLDLLNTKYDIHDQHHILRLKEWFVFRNHLVFVNELLSLNLYDLLKQNQYQGLSTNLVRVLVQQILDAMIVLNKAMIIHADLKPENILLEGMEKPVVKVIDFGSACFEWQTTFTYIQSRFYRSPEILLGLPYSSRIDMWSLGCIVAELYLGLPLFPGSSEYNQLSRIVDLLKIPPRNMLERARRTDEFFNYLGPGTWDLKTMTQYARERNVEEKQSKRYFTATTLHDLVMTYPIRRRMSDAEQQREFQSRIALIDFLRGLLQLDPNLRWTPRQASMHPFITGEPFIEPFVPPRDAEDPGDASRSYGATPDDSHSHGRTSDTHHSSHGGGYGQSHTISYAAGHSGGPNANGYATHTLFDGSGNGSGSASMLGGTLGSLEINGMTWAHRTGGLQAQDGNTVPTGGGVLSLPGAFPVNNGSGTQSYQSSHGGSQASHHNSRERLRASTFGHSAGLSLPQSSTNGQVPVENAHSYQYSQQQLPGSFLGVDPSASRTCDLLETNSEEQGAPGRSDISLSNSEYSASDSSSRDWSSRAETDSSSNCAPSSAASHRLQTESLCRYRAPGLTVHRSYLLSERQQQRLVQQRQLQSDEFNRAAGIAAAMVGAGTGIHQASSDTARAQLSPVPMSGAGQRLVSNFSPLTLPSTPGSSEYYCRNTSSAINDKRYATDRIGFGRQLVNEELGADSTEGSVIVSVDLEIPRPLTQAIGSESSSSPFSAISDNDDSGDGALSGHGTPAAEQGWLSTGMLSMSSGSNNELVLNEEIPSIYGALPDKGQQSLLLATQEHRGQNVFSSASNPNLPHETSHSWTNTKSSIYLQSRYAACSQDILLSAKGVGYAMEGGGEKHQLRPALSSASDKCWESDNCDVSDNQEFGGEISQEEEGGSGSESSFSDHELDKTVEDIWRLSLDQGQSGRDIGSVRSTLFQSTDAYRYASSTTGSSISDGEGEDKGSLDTVLFVGKLRSSQSIVDSNPLKHPLGGVGDIAKGRTGQLATGTLHLMSSPMPQGIGSALAATHPQKVMKKSQQLRNERQLHMKDSLRMVESLRRMGKWRGAELPYAVDEFTCANMF